MTYFIDKRANRRGGSPRGTGPGAAIRALALAALALLAPGCEPRVALWGLVTDTSGAPLPGVFVKVEGTEAFAISNANGYFGRRPNRLPVPPGELVLRYMKTGFTTAELPIAPNEGRSLEVPTMALWPLPPARGIYDWSGHRYRGWTRVEPDRYSSANLSPVFGTRIEPDLVVEQAMGLIVGYKIAPYDWRLSRLEQVPVLRPGLDGSAVSGDAPTETVWAESVRIPVQAVAIDEPEQLLWEIRPTRALGPGVYALHWGALEGDPSTDAAAYLIEVASPPAAEEDLDPDGKTEPGPGGGGASDS